jgi:uncharacterized protein (DUF4415 family)
MTSRKGQTTERPGSNIRLIPARKATRRETKDYGAFSRGTRGAIVQPEPGKTRITIRLDEDVIDWFRNQVNETGGGNYQTLIN